MKNMNNRIRLSIGCGAIAIAFAMNFNYARNGYGLSFLKAEALTEAPNQYECDTDGKGHFVMCDSRAQVQMAYITCPYYVKQFWMRLEEIETQSEKIEMVGKCEGWSDTVLASSFPENAYDPEKFYDRGRWTECSAQPTPTPITNNECEYDGHRGGRCTIIHKDCSDLSLGGSAS